MGSTAGDSSHDAYCTAPVVDLILVTTDKVTVIGVDSSTIYYLPPPCLAYEMSGSGPWGDTACRSH